MTAFLFKSLTFVVDGGGGVDDGGDDDVFVIVAIPNALRCRIWKQKFPIKWNLRQNKTAKKKGISNRIKSLKIIIKNHLS